MNTSFENALTFQFPAGPFPAHGLATPFGSLATGMQPPQPQIDLSLNGIGGSNLAKSKQKKPARKSIPKPTNANTTRNLFMIDFCNEHGEKTTNEDFNKAWKSISIEKLKDYQARVNTRKVDEKAKPKKK